MVMRAIKTLTAGLMPSLLCWLIFVRPDCFAAFFSMSGRHFVFDWRCDEFCERFGEDWEGF
jgi:hypothetical protein